MRACLFLAVVLFVSWAQGGFVETVYTASLSNNQEVPLPNNPPGSSGTAVCVFSRNSSPQIIDCEVEHSVTDVTAAHIHVAPRGSAGQIVFTFSGGLGSNFRESFSLEDQEGYTAEQMEHDFLSGLWYFNIHSEEYPSGEIRGQIEHTDNFYARMSSDHTIPHAPGTSAKGIAVGTFSRQTRFLEINLVHSVQSPATNGLEIHFGAEGDVGPLVYAFQHSESPIYDSVQYTITEEQDFADDLHYLNLVSVNNPTGEIRGQMVTINYIDELAFTSRLGGGQSIPPTQSNNRGAGLFAYHCDTKILEYVVMHNVPDATGAFIGAAPAGVPGATLFSLSGPRSPIYGSILLSPEEELLLYSRELFVLVTSPQFPSGEIRGQITVDFDFWAYLSGTSVVSPVTTPAVGIATMTLLGEQNRRLDYSIFHGVEFPLRASLSVARAGENGPIDLVFPSVFSPIRGDDIVLDDDELEAFATGGSYISITSSDYPFIGEIRGQVRRVNPCTASNDNSLTVSASVDISTNLPPSISFSRTFGSFYSYSFGNDTSDSSGRSFSFSSGRSSNSGSDSPSSGGDDDNASSTLHYSVALVFASLCLSVFISYL